MSEDLLSEVEKMEKEKYIQLPPIPEELDGNVVRMIWEYTKLPEKICIFGSSYNLKMHFFDD